MNGTPLTFAGKPVSGFRVRLRLEAGFQGGPPTAAQSMQVRNHGGRDAGTKQPVTQIVVRNSPRTG